MRVLNSCIAILLFACSAAENSPPEETNSVSTGNEPVKTEAKSKKFRGVFTNGLKGDSIFFNISADGKKLEELVFKGYWRCAGRIESMLAGPEGSYDIVNNKVAGHITEPPDGGSTAWRFDLEANLKGNTATGTFRMAINNMGCDTYKLNWTASSY